MLKFPTWELKDTNGLAAGSGTRATTQLIQCLWHHLKLFFLSLFLLPYIVPTVSYQQINHIIKINLEKFSILYFILIQTLDLFKFSCDLFNSNTLGSLEEKSVIIKDSPRSLSVRVGRDHNSLLQIWSESSRKAIRTLQIHLRWKASQNEHQNQIHIFWSSCIIKKEYNKIAESIFI